MATRQIQQLVLIGSGRLLRLWSGCTVVAFYEFIQGITLPASTFNRAIHAMILLVSRVLKRTPRTGLSREDPCAERDRRNPAVCSHRINHFAASWRLLHQGWLAIGTFLGGDTTARSHDQVLPSILPHHGSTAACAEMLVTLDRAGRSTLPITRRRAFRSTYLASDGR